MAGCECVVLLVNATMSFILNFTKTFTLTGLYKIVAMGTILGVTFATNNVAKVLKFIYVYLTRLEHV